MELTREVLDRFFGGQAEIQNAGDGYICRGEIQRISVERETLIITFSWCAGGEGFPPLPINWFNADSEDDLSYGMSLDLCSVNDIGDGRIELNADIAGELITLFPAGGNRLDPATVAGLDLTPYGVTRARLDLNGVAVLVIHGWRGEHRIVPHIDDKRWVTIEAPRRHDGECWTFPHIQDGVLVCFTDLLGDPLLYRVPGRQPLVIKLPADMMDAIEVRFSD